MANPAPIYIVSYAGEQLPGYVQSDDRPIVFGNSTDNFFGRDGGLVTPTGAGLRDIALQFHISSTLGSGYSGLQHLDNVLDQYRSAAAILTRPYGQNSLVIHDSDRYYLASFERMSAPLTADRSRSIKYTVDFIAQPWAISTVAQTGSFSGDGTVNITGMAGSRRTYPVFDIPATVTAFTATDGYGHTLTFLRGTYPGQITVDCATMLVYRTSNNANSINTMVTLNFNLYYSPDSDTFPITITGYAGSGTVDISVPKRYEL